MELLDLAIKPKSPQVIAGDIYYKHSQPKFASIDCVTFYLPRNVTLCTICEMYDTTRYSIVCYEGIELQNKEDYI